MHHHEHVAEVLGGRAKQAGTADVDLLHERVKRCIGIVGRFAERIQIHDDQIDRLNSLRANRLEVIRAVPARKDAAKYRGMQCFYASIHHFWETCYV